jgi:hypothetical protein
MMFEAFTSQTMNRATFWDAQQCSLPNTLQIYAQEPSANIFIEMDVQSISIYSTVCGVAS